MLKILKLFNPNQKKLFIILVGLITTSSVLEMIGLAIIVPIINSFLEIEANTKEFNLMLFSNFLGLSNLSISTFLIIFIIFFCFKNLFSIFVSWKQQDFIYTYIDKISFNLYSKYLSQDFKQYSLKNSSELMRNILKEIDLFRAYLESFIQIILESIILFGIFIFLIYVLTIPTLIAISFSIIVSIIYYLLVKKNLLSWGEQRQKIEHDRITFMQEGFSSIKEINFFNRNNFFIKRFKEKNKKFYQITKNFYFLNSIPRFIFEFFTVSIILIILIYLILAEYSNEVVIKVISLFLAASFRIIPSVYRIFNSVQNLKYSTSSFNTLYNDYKYLTIKDEMFEPQNLNFEKKINLQVKEFHYNADNKFKIENISLEILKNQKIGIIGKSGSGKSTIIDILGGILKDKSINLKVDDKPIESKNDQYHWQKKIGLIPQNISILNETLRENILFGLSSKQFSDKEVLKSIELSNLKNLLLKLPDGLDHKIKEKGLNFSGGELQRIGIARALVFDPEILIFDEATSALDTFTENEILKDINSLKSKTIIMISHRMNTLKYCDKIYLIDKGKIKDDGSYDKFNEKY